MAHESHHPPPSPLPLEDSLGDAGALRPLAAALAIFVSCRQRCSTRDLFRHLRLAVSRVSEASLLPRVGEKKEKFRPKIKRSQAGDEPQIPQEGEKCQQTAKRKRESGRGKLGLIYHAFYLGGSTEPLATGNLLSKRQPGKLPHLQCWQRFSKESF